MHGVGQARRHRRHHAPPRASHVASMHAPVCWHDFGPQEGGRDASGSDAAAVEASEGQDSGGGDRDPGDPASVSFDMH